MPRFTLKVAEGGKALGTADVSVPELSFVPETAAVHETSSGAETALLGWANQLWAPMREPGRGASRSRPVLGFDRFAELAQGAGGAGNPFDGPPAFESPFVPNRFSHPLAVRRGATRAEIHQARIAEIADAAARLAVIGGVVHRAVHEPVLVQRIGRDGVAVDVDFRDPGAAVAGPAWSLFRADRDEDAIDFARHVAKGAGLPFAGASGGIRVIYPHILRVDDVRLAMGDAADRFLRLAAATGGGGPKARSASDALRADVLARTAFADADEASRASDAVRLAFGALDGLGLPDDDMRLEATREVCGHVLARFEAYDHDHLVARDAGPSFAP